MAKQIILDTWSDLIAKSEEIYKEYLKDLDNRTVTKKDIDDKISKALSESELNIDVNVNNKISTAISEYEEKDDAQELSLINDLYARIIEELNNRGYITITVVEQKIQEEIVKVVNGASDDFDTLKEISDWISSHGSSAASMNSQIKKNEADIFTIQTDIETINNTLSTKESIIDHTKDFNTLSVNLANTTIALRDYIDSSIVRIKEVVDTKVDNEEYRSSIVDKVSLTDFNSVISEINSSLSTKVDSATYDEDILVMKTAIADNTGSATGIKAALEQLEKNLKNYADAGDEAHNSLDIEIDGKLDISVYNIDKDIFVSSIDSKVDSSIFNNTIDDVEKSFEDKINKKVDTSLYNNKISQLDSSIDNIKSSILNINSELLEQVEHLNGEDSRLNGLIDANTTKIETIESTAGSALNTALDARTKNEEQDSRLYALENTPTPDYVEMIIEATSTRHYKLFYDVRCVGWLEIDGKETELPEITEDRSASYYAVLSQGRHVVRFRPKDGTMADGTKYKEREGLLGWCADNCVTEITLPEGWEVINSKMFEGAATLRRVNLPSTILEVRFGAFGGCEALEEIVLPPSVKTIGHIIAHDCPLLKRIVLGGSDIAVTGTLAQSCAALECVEFRVGGTVTFSGAANTFVNLPQLARFIIRGNFPTFECSQPFTSVGYVGSSAAAEVRWIFTANGSVANGTKWQTSLLSQCGFTAQKILFYTLN